MSEIDQIRSRARAALDLRRYDQAASEAERLLAAAGPSAPGFALLAQAQLGLARFKDAEQSALAGLAQDPSSEHLLRILAVARGQEGRTAEALEDIDEALRVAPDQALAHYYRSQCLEKLGRYDEAVAACRRALELAPDDADTLVQLGSLAFRKDAVRAEHWFREALRLQPNNLAALQYLGTSLLKQKKIDEARTAFRSALLIDPTFKGAKEGLHASVKRTLAKVGGIVIVTVAAIRALSMGSRVVGPEAGLDPVQLGISCVAIVCGLLLFPRWTRARNRAELAKRDPQLLQIYERLEADKKAGRL